MLETLTDCPACRAPLDPTTPPALEARDWLVTGETFALRRCAACSLLMTNPRPTAETIGRYYESDAYISHTGQSPGLIGALYRQVRTITLGGKVRLINKLTKGHKGRLLDVGCATGHFLVAARRDGWQVTGTEPDEGARQIAYAQGVDVRPSVDDLAGVVTHDVITMWHVLEHVHDLADTVERLYDLLTPGGHLIVAVPNHGSADAQHYGADWAAYDVPRHLYHFVPATLKGTIERAGFRFLRQQGMFFDAVYVSMISAQNGGGNKLGGALTGLASNGRALLSGEWSSLTYIFQKPA